MDTYLVNSWKTTSQTSKLAIIGAVSSILVGSFFLQRKLFNTSNSTDTGESRRLLSSKDAIVTDCPPTTSEYNLIKSTNEQSEIITHFRSKNSINPNQFIFDSNYQRNDRGQMIYTANWTPTNASNDISNINGIIIFFHGYCNYLGGYTFDLCQKLCVDGNYIVFAIEYVGHGRSDGLHGFVPSFDDIAKDVVKFSSQFVESVKLRLNIKANKTKTTQKQLNTYLLGVSMGGAIVLETVRLHATNSEFKNFYNSINGIVLCAPLIGFDEQFKLDSFTHGLLTFMSKLVPTWAVIPSGDDLYQYTSQNKEYFERIEGNPMFYNGNARLGTGMEFTRKLTMFQSKGFCDQFTKPVLILHGKDDRVCDPSISQYFFDNCQSSDKTLKLLDNTWHYLFMEPTADECFQYIFEWLNQHNRVQ